ncbi:MAG: hypothetical protein GX635_11460 [Synergistaceae bacterium]|nr:hypothetical protein [Synergistaceae bacterium]
MHTLALLQPLTQLAQTGKPLLTHKNRDIRHFYVQGKCERRQERGIDIGEANSDGWDLLLVLHETDEKLLSFLRLDTLFNNLEFDIVNRAFFRLGLAFSALFEQNGEVGCKLLFNPIEVLLYYRNLRNMIFPVVANAGGLKRQGAPHSPETGDHKMDVRSLSQTPGVVCERLEKRRVGLRRQSAPQSLSPHFVKIEHPDFYIGSLLVVEQVDILERVEDIGISDVQKARERGLFASVLEQADVLLFD